MAAKQPDPSQESVSADLKNLEAEHNKTPNDTNKKALDDGLNKAKTKYETVQSSETGDPVDDLLTYLADASKRQQARDEEALKKKQAAEIQSPLHTEQDKAQEEPKQDEQAKASTESPQEPEQAEQAEEGTFSPLHTEQDKAQEEPKQDEQAKASTESTQEQEQAEETEEEALDKPTEQDPLIPPGTEGSDSQLGSEQGSPEAGANPQGLMGNLASAWRSIRNTAGTALSSVFSGARRVSSSVEVSDNVDEKTFSPFRAAQDEVQAKASTEGTQEPEQAEQAEEGTFSPFRAAQDEVQAKASTESPQELEQAEDINVDELDDITKEDYLLDSEYERSDSPSAPRTPPAKGPKPEVRYTSNKNTSTGPNEPQGGTPPIKPPKPIRKMSDGNTPTAQDEVQTKASAGSEQKLEQGGPKADAKPKGLMGNLASTWSGMRNTAGTALSSVFYGVRRAFSSGEERSSLLDSAQERSDSQSVKKGKTDSVGVSGKADEQTFSPLHAAEKAEQVKPSRAERTQEQGVVLEDTVSPFHSRAAAQEVVNQSMPEQRSNGSGSSNENTNENTNEDTHTSSI